MCDACNHGKSHRLSFHTSIHKSQKPLELIHFDVWGPDLFFRILGFYTISFLLLILEMIKYKKKAWTYH